MKKKITKEEINLLDKYFRLANYLSVGQLYLLDNPLLKRELDIKGPVIIGDNVWIGDKVSILSNVTIGKGSVIACNAVVTKDVPPYSVVGGVPAKVIKQISPNT